MSNFGIMFHHFHDETKHIRCQGSICANDLRQMINHLSKDYSIIDAGAWFDMAVNEQLKPNQICLTFDDALACQYDVAYPLLKEYGIQAFWFVYTSIYSGTVEKLEVYRHFRFSCFESIDSFYTAFFHACVENQDVIGVDIEKEIEQFNPDEYLQSSTFYSNSDKLFRYFRDAVLNGGGYNFVMDSMIDSCGYDIDANKNLLWITEEQILKLHKEKHLIGLHSHTHPTTMAAKTFDEQLDEYSKNKEKVESIIQDRVHSVSYPCGSYNKDTGIIMDKLGVQLGFDKKMSNIHHSKLYFPRYNHAYVMKEMAK